MKVTVRSIGLIRQALGGAELAVSMPEGSTVRDLLAQLVEEKGEGLAPYALEPKEPTSYVRLRVVVNGRDFLPQQYEEAVLKEADDILIFTPIAGG